MKIWLGEKRFMRYMGVFALIAFPLVMLVHGPSHAWKEWREIFWDKDQSHEEER